MLNKVFIGLLCLLLTACATSPTGRSQFIYLPDSQLNAMGIQAFDNIKTAQQQSKNSRYNHFVHCIAQAITAETVGDWEVVVFADDSLNAFALPGNKIGVHTGLIKLVDNQDQLATVIAHEVGHVLARHSNERLSQTTAVNQTISLISAVSNPTSTLGKLAISSLGIGAQYGIILPFSRMHESEADIIALDFMAQAGFDPRQSINLWQKMDQAGQHQQPAEFLSTHPSHSTRIKQLTAHMPIAMGFYKQARSIHKRPRCIK
jgi:predicted Zn-dependent protease